MFAYNIIKSNEMKKKLRYILIYMWPQEPHRDIRSAEVMVIFSWCTGGSLEPGGVGRAAVVKVTGASLARGPPRHVGLALRHHRYPQAPIVTTTVLILLHIWEYHWGQ